MLTIPEDSPLRKPPAAFSRKQVIILDGIRYAAEMADIAYERLCLTLQEMAAALTEPLVRDNATAMLDAWSIVDSSHRFRDLIANLPGVANSAWKRNLRDHTSDVDALRDRVQHQLGEIDGLVENGGQLWGYLSWAELREGRYTGNWFMLAAGSEYVGDRFFYMGPVHLPFDVPPGRVRLNAFGDAVYLGRTVAAIGNAVAELSRAIADGSMRPIGNPALERRGADIVCSGVMEALYRVEPSAGNEADPTNGDHGL